MRCITGCAVGCIVGCIFWLGKGRFLNSPRESIFAAVPWLPIVGKKVNSLISKDIERTYYIRFARYIALESDSEISEQSHLGGLS